ncbi:winged helix-turn-helix domain-containing protein [Kitasatospora sp. NPDC091276]|uniref:winged helix-turn-helix domain-containing protein n=1 Tax=unclassified Kitasatospora TaxID=2633591 RepID=UPI00341247E2
MSPKSAYQWHQLWRDGGAQALASRGPSGSRCRLPPRCLKKLAAYLDQRPAAHGWVEDQVWTAARVATPIGRKLHVSYSVSGATRPMHRLGLSPQVPARRVAERGVAERDFTALVGGVHHLAKAPIALVRDRLYTNISHAIGELIAERDRLTVFLLPAHSPDLNPVEWVWAHVKHSLANLAVVALDRLETLVRNRLKRLQYRPDTPDGFIAGTGLTLDTPTSP